MYTIHYIQALIRTDMSHDMESVVQYMGNSGVSVEPHTNHTLQL